MEGSYKLVVQECLELTEEHARLAAEYKAYRTQVAKQLATINRVYRSLSWRITKPLRAIKGAGRRSAS